MNPEWKEVVIPMVLPNGDIYEILTVVPGATVLPVLPGIMCIRFSLMAEVLRVSFRYLKTNKLLVSDNRRRIAPSLIS
jgi:hypothetical protein